MPEVGTSSAAPFPSILCGVEGDRASTDAAWQAIALAALGAALHFIAMYTTFRLAKYSEEELGGGCSGCGRSRDFGIDQAG